MLGLRCELTVSGGRDHRIAQVAEHQRGLISRRQLIAIKIGYGAIRRMVQRHWLIPARSGVYFVGHAAPAPLNEATAALLAVRDGAVLSHLTAAGIWGLTGRGSADVHGGAWSPDSPIHITVAGSAASVPAGVSIHRTTRLAPEDLGIHLELPVTAPGRTLLDIAPLVRLRTLELAYDRALVDRLVSRDQLAEVIARHRNHPGRRALLALLDPDRPATTTVTRSEAEERLLELIRASQLPLPVMNARVCGYEVDFWWKSERLVVEVDGYRFHSTRRAFEHDRRKSAALAAAGILTMRVTWRQSESEPVAVIARLAQALARSELR